MGNDPGNMVDPTGGTAGGLGAAIGFVGGSIAGWMWQDKKGTGFFGKLGAALGGGLLGAGIGYAIGESANPSATFNESRSIFGNFRGFYVGLIQGNKHIGKLGVALWSPDIFKLGSLAAWIPSVTASVKIVESLYKVIQLGPLQQEGYKEWPNYAGEFNLDHLPEGSSYKIEPPRPSEVNFSSYDGMPSKGSIEPGRHKIDIRVRSNELVREQTNHNREINQARITGMNVEQFIENRRRNIRNTIYMNNQSEIKIYRSDKISRPFRYLEIFGIPLKFIRKKG
jgi:hypothetical protein